MRLVQRLLAPVGFAVVAFCYGLPFAALRLDDSTLHLAQTFSGRDLVIGGKSRAHVESMLEEHGPMQVLPNSEIPSYLGGDGVTSDFPVMRHMANLESVRTYEGTDEVHTLVIGQALTGLRAFS